jgi:acetyl-CoA synthetase
LEAVWRPSHEWVERTNVWRFMKRLGFADREEFLAFSVAEPERFWDEMMQEMRVDRNGRNGSSADV